MAGLPDTTSARLLRTLQKSPGDVSSISRLIQQLNAEQRIEEERARNEFLMGLSPAAAGRVTHERLQAGFPDEASQESFGLNALSFIGQALDVLGRPVRGAIGTGISLFQGDFGEAGERALGSLPFGLLGGQETTGEDILEELGIEGGSTTEDERRVRIAIAAGMPESEARRKFMTKDRPLASEAQIEFDNIMQLAVKNKPDIDLEATFGDMTSAIDARDVAGLFVEIGLDPATYLTFGLSAAGKAAKLLKGLDTATSAATKGTKAGMSVVGELSALNLRALKKEEAVKQAHEVIDSFSDIIGKKSADRAKKVIKPLIEAGGEEAFRLGDTLAQQSRRGQRAFASLPGFLGAKKVIGSRTLDDFLTAINKSSLAETFSQPGAFDDLSSFSVSMAESLPGEALKRINRFFFEKIGRRTGITGIDDALAAAGREKGADLVFFRDSIADLEQRAAATATKFGLKDDEILRYVSDTVEIGQRAEIPSMVGLRENVQGIADGVALLNSTIMRRLEAASVNITSLTDETLGYLRRLATPKAIRFLRNKNNNKKFTEWSGLEFTAEFDAARARNRKFMGKTHTEINQSFREEMGVDFDLFNPNPFESTYDALRKANIAIANANFVRHIIDKGGNKLTGDAVEELVRKTKKGAKKDEAITFGAPDILRAMEKDGVTTAYHLHEKLGLIRPLRDPQLISDSLRAVDTHAAEMEAVELLAIDIEMRAAKTQKARNALLKEKDELLQDLGIGEARRAELEAQVASLAKDREAAARFIKNARSGLIRTVSDLTSDPSNSEAITRMILDNVGVEGLRKATGRGAPLGVRTLQEVKDAITDRFTKAKERIEFNDDLVKEYDHEIARLKKSPRFEDGPKLELLKEGRKRAVSRRGSARRAAKQAEEEANKVSELKTLDQLKLPEMQDVLKAVDETVLEESEGFFDQALITLDSGLLTRESVDIEIARVNELLDEVKASKIKPNERELARLGREIESTLRQSARLKKELRSPSKQKAKLRKERSTALKRLKGYKDVSLESIDVDSQLKDLEELASIAVPDEVASLLTRTLELQFNPLPFLQGLEQLTNKMKASVTLPFFAFHGRNMIENTYKFLVEAGPAAMKWLPAAAKVIAETVDTTGRFSGLGANLTQKGLRRFRDGARKIKAPKTYFVPGHGDLNYLELQQLMRELGVSGGIQTRVAAEFAGVFDQPRGKLASVFLGRPGGIRETVEKGLYRFNGANEDMYRIGMFLRKTQDEGMSAVQAAEEVKRVFFDYSDISNWERGFSRLLFFYNFYRHNMRYVLQSLVRHPQVTKQTLKLFEDDPDNPFNHMASKMGSFDAFGRNISIGAIPQAQLGVFSLGEGDVAEKLSDKMGELAAKGNPILTKLAEITFGVELYSGRDLLDLDRSPEWMASLPSPLKESLGIVADEQADGTIRYRMDPSARLLLTLTPTMGRIMQTTEFLSDSKTDAVEKTFRFFTGVRVQDLNSDKAQTQLARNRIERAAKNVGGIEKNEFGVLFIDKKTERGKVLSALFSPSKSNLRWLAFDPAIAMKMGPYIRTDEFGDPIITAELREMLQREMMEQEPEMFAVLQASEMLRKARRGQTIRAGRERADELFRSLLEQAGGSPGRTQ